VTPSIESQLRARIASAWAEFQASEDDPRKHTEAFKRYCDALYDAHVYASRARDGTSRKPG